MFAKGDDVGSKVLCMSIQMTLKNAKWRSTMAQVKWNIDQVILLLIQDLFFKDRWPIFTSHSTSNIVYHIESHNFVKTDVSLINGTSGAVVWSMIWKYWQWWKQRRQCNKQSMLMFGLWLWLWLQRIINLVNFHYILFCSHHLPSSSYNTNTLFDQLS